MWHNLNSDCRQVDYRWPREEHLIFSLSLFVEMCACPGQLNEWRKRPGEKGNELRRSTVMQKLKIMQQNLAFRKIINARKSNNSII